MQFGGPSVITDEIRSLGFAIVEEVKVLGMNITRDPDQWNNNFTSIYDTLLAKNRILETF
jgi:hypothetical protein